MYMYISKDFWSTTRHVSSPMYPLIEICVRYNLISMQETVRADCTLNTPDSWTNITLPVGGKPDGLGRIFPDTDG